MCEDVNNIIAFFRDVAQSGSALHWGCSGRRFKSGHPDQIFINLLKSICNNN